MPELNPLFTLHISGVLLYLVLILISLGQRGIRDRIARCLSFFLGVSVLIEIGYLLIAIDLVRPLPDMVFTNLGLYGILLGSIFLLQLSILFFRRKVKWYGWSSGLIFLGVTVFLDYIQVSTPYRIYISPQLSIFGSQVLQLMLEFGWLIFIAATVWRTFQAYRQEEMIVKRSRIWYWSLGLALVITGDIFIILQRSLIGGLLKNFGALMISYIVLTTRLPDIRGVLKQIGSTIISVFLELTIYVLGFLVFQLFYGELSRYDPLLISVGLGFALLIIINPLIILAKKLTQRVFYGSEKDYSQILREYSKNVSSVLDLKFLAKLVVDMIGEWIDVDQGIIFIVDSELDENNERRYRLTGVPGTQAAQSPPGFLSIDSHLTSDLVNERRSITISEIEMLPIYQSANRGEQSWFKRHKMDIFVPIFGKDEWIGLLALGPKSSGASYSKADITLLETLADQTAVALQNARLVESLVRVNNEFRRAYTAMEDAHTKLERLNRTKSDFISISSHELRTPLSVLSGYSQMLAEDPIFIENDYYRRVIKGIEEGTTRLDEIVDSMLEVAKIDTSALELRALPIKISELIQEVSTGFKDATAERNMNLIFEDLKLLPPAFGDPEALSKVFYHLISNAIKYTPDGGRITISGSEIPKGDPKFADGGIEIVVRDTGMGIDPRFLDLIFTKFYQTGELSMHSSGKTKFKGGGPGLGLAIVRGIIQAHGGRVWAESPGYDEEIMPGSEFHVILPGEKDAELGFIRPERYQGRYGPKVIFVFLYFKCFL